MSIRFRIVVPIVVSALFLFTFTTSMVAMDTGLLTKQSTPFDNDGDTLPDDFDLDDDNDGIMDSEDPSPLDPDIPGSGAPPAPQPGDGVLDTDGDGLPDDRDLDDDNDGVADQDDPEPFNPAVSGNPPVPSPEPPVVTPPTDPDPNPEAPTDPAEPAPGNEAPPVIPEANEPPAEASYDPVVPVVTALPSTGVGTHSGYEFSGLALAVVSALAAILIAFHRDQHVV